MTGFSVGSFNTRNLIGPGQEFFRFERYSQAEYDWKEGWLADQLVLMNADIVGFQEVFEEAPLRGVIARADAAGRPEPETGFPHRAPFLGPAYAPYDEAALIFAPSEADSGPANRRPGVALLSRFGFVEPPEVVQRLETPLTIPFHELGGGDAGAFTLRRLSRPLIRARVPVGSHVVTVFNCHLKSGMGEFIRPRGARFSPEIDLLAYDAAGRADGFLRAALRRMAEACVMRRMVIEELRAGHPVLVLGDFNAPETTTSSLILEGEAPLPDYTWMRRPLADRPDDRYTAAESARIRETIEGLRLHSAEALSRRGRGRDVSYTTNEDGVPESVDRILMSRHFHPDNPDRIADIAHFAAFNDHLAGSGAPGGATGRLISDHGQIVAHLRLRPPFD